MHKRCRSGDYGMRATFITQTNTDTSGQKTYDHGMTDSDRLRAMMETIDNYT
jgi:hypothetical protein